MSINKPNHLKTGDIFTIPVDSDRAGYGQIVHIAQNESLLIAVFEQVYPVDNRPDTEEITADDVLYLGFTTSTLFLKNHWQMTGHSIRSLNRIRLPYYKQGHYPAGVIVDCFGRRLRQAQKEEWDQLNYKVITAPERIEAALRAFYDDNEIWLEEYDQLLYERTLESIGIAEAKPD